MLQTLQQATACGSWGIVELEEAPPVETHHRQDGTKLNDKSKSMNERIALRNTQQILSDNHVTCRRYRQEFRQTLNDSNDNCF